MKSVNASIDLDPADFIIKWRITEMCNVKCSYCMHIQREELTDGLIKPQEERLCEVASQISKLLDKTDFNKVKIDMIGGEVTIFDLKKIVSHVNTPKLKRINLTTNFLKGKEYYKDFAMYCRDRGIEVTATASFHYEFQTFEKYFEKIEYLKPFFKILACEVVSNEDNQDLVRRFCDKCKELDVDYMCDVDLRLEKEDSRQKGLINETGKSYKTPRYKVFFTDGSEKEYISRNQFLQDKDVLENRWQKAIFTNELFCTNSYNYIYIAFDTVGGRKKDDPCCCNKIKIEDFEIVKPSPCVMTNCTICGHQSLWRAGWK